MLSGVTSWQRAWSAGVKRGPGSTGADHWAECLSGQRCFGSGVAQSQLQSACTLTVNLYWPYCLEKDKVEPELADLIEFSCAHGVYKHWAVYVGNGYVVHLTDPSGALSTFSVGVWYLWKGKAVVKKALLREVAGARKYKVNNKHDGKYPPLSPSEIVQRAEEQVGREKPYSVSVANCEHFVNEMRYGVWHGDQGRNFCLGYTGVSIASVLAVTTAVSGPAAAACASVLGATGRTIGILLEIKKQKKQKKQ